MTFPDLRPCFRHYQWRPMRMGALVGCDWADKDPADPVFGVYTKNGSLTVDETQILFDCVRRLPGAWLDIGGSTGWSAAHMAKAGAYVDSIDPMYSLPEFEARTIENLHACGVLDQVLPWPLTSNAYFSFRGMKAKFVGVLIDGEHDAPGPEHDAVHAQAILAETGCILFHDGNLAPVQAGIRALVDMGFEHRDHHTAQGLVACWRGRNLAWE